MRETVKEKVNMFDVGGMAMDWFTLYCMCAWEIRPKLWYIYIIDDHLAGHLDAVCGYCY